MSIQKGQSNGPFSYVAWAGQLPTTARHRLVGPLWERSKNGLATAVGRRLGVLVEQAEEMAAPDHWQVRAALALSVFDKPVRETHP